MAKDVKQPPGPDDIGMDRPTLKKLLARARRQATNCALAQGSSQSGGQGLVLLDKTMPSKQIVRSLKQEFPDLRTPCFGSARIDVKSDPKLVVFRMNKRIPGLDRKIRRSLKGSGYTKVTIELASEGGGEKG